MMFVSKKQSFSMIILLASFLSLTYSLKNNQIKRIQGGRKLPATKTPIAKEVNKKEALTGNLWQTLNLKAKDNVKQFFVNRATKGGIPWNEYVNLGTVNMDQLLSNYLEVNDASIEYPEYYVQPFHSYEEGNLNWQAALEVLPATYAVSANYWPEEDVFQAESWMRKNTTNSIAEHIFNYERYAPSTYPDTGKIMDVGCSVGASTKFLIEAFPDKSEISAVDLSPHFLSAAKFFLEDTRSPMYCEVNEKIKYHHALAENMPFESDSYDIVSISFLTHEVPTNICQEIIAEAYRVLRPGGTLSMVDLNGKRIKSLPQPRKYFFELTEPFIRQYYKTDHMKQLKDTGFTFIESKRNDPMNTLWIASKPSGALSSKTFAKIDDFTFKTFAKIDDFTETRPPSPPLTALGLRLAAGAKAAGIPAPVPKVPKFEADPALEALVPINETFLQSIVNFLADEFLWSMARKGAYVYIIGLLLTDFLAIYQKYNP